MAILAPVFLLAHAVPIIWPTLSEWAVTVMMGGITVLGVVTATIASWMVESIGEESAEEETVSRAHVEALSDEVRALRAELSHVAASGAPGPPVADSTTSSSAGERAAPS
jgi:voltage-gated potassium channel